MSDINAFRNENEALHPMATITNTPTIVLKSMASMTRFIAAEADVNAGAAAVLVDAAPVPLAVARPALPAGPEPEPELELDSIVDGLEAVDTLDCVTLVAFTSALRGTVSKYIRRARRRRRERPQRYGWPGVLADPVHQEISSCSEIIN